MGVNPLEDHVANVEIVLVLKQHVAVAEDSRRRQVKHGCISSCLIDLIHVLLTVCKSCRPIERRSVDIADVVTEDHQGRELGEFRDLRL